MRECKWVRGEREKIGIVKRIGRGKERGNVINISPASLCLQTRGTIRLCTHSHVEVIMSFLQGINYSYYMWYTHKPFFITQGVTLWHGSRNPTVTGGIVIIYKKRFIHGEAAGLLI